eukprot:1103387-Amphidinium_carterae.2
MAGSADGVARLKALLSDARIADAVIAFMTAAAPAGLGLESVSDYASFFTKDDYASAVQTDILDKIPDYANDRVQRGRLRTAWTLAEADLLAFTARKAAGTSEDLDMPLDPADQRAQEDLFTATHHLRLEPAIAPSDSLFARCYREFKKESVSVLPLAKVKSALEVGAVASSSKRRRLAEGVEIRLQGEEQLPDIRFSSVLQVLHALLSLVHAWALTGTNERDSRLHIGSRTKEGDLSEGMAYF